MRRYWYLRSFERYSRQRLLYRSIPGLSRRAIQPRHDFACPIWIILNRLDAIVLDHATVPTRLALLRGIHGMLLVSSYCLHIILCTIKCWCACRLESSLIMHLHYHHDTGRGECHREMETVRSCKVLTPCCSGTITRLRIPGTTSTTTLPGTDLPSLLF